MTDKLLLLIFLAVVHLHPRTTKFNLLICHSNEELDLNGS